MSNQPTKRPSQFNLASETAGKLDKANQLAEVRQKIRAVVSLLLIA